MRITCSCGKKLQVNDALAGKRVKCPGCGQAILAREDGAPESAKAAPARPPRPTFSEEEDEDSPRPRSRHREEEEEDEDAPRRRPRIRADDDEGRPAAKGVSVLGIVSLVLGILGALVSLFPCIGWIVGIPLAGIGLILGLIGLVVALKGKQTGPALPIAGTAVSVLGLVISGAWLAYIGVAANQVGQQVQQVQAQIEAERAKEEEERQQIRSGPAIDVTADTLVKDFSDNAIAADGKYKGKILAVKGTVERVKDVDWRITVELKAQGGLATVECNFATEQRGELAGLKPGQQVTIRGKCQGKLISPMLEKCVLMR